MRLRFLFTLGFAITMFAQAIILPDVREDMMWWAFQGGTWAVIILIWWSISLLMKRR